MIRNVATGGGRAKHCWSAALLTRSDGSAIGAGEVEAAAVAGACSDKRSGGQTSAAKRAVAAPLALQQLGRSCTGQGAPVVQSCFDTQHVACIPPGAAQV